MKMRNKNVCIIGNGSWGKALFHVITSNGEQVRIAGRGEEVTENIIILSVPTQSLRSLKPFLKTRTRTPIIINTAKGIEEKTHKLPQDIIKELFSNCRYYSLIGPSFAGEVMKNMPTIVNLGYENDAPINNDIASMLQNDYFRIRLTKGIAVLELSGALKNIYAIGCGLADGLGYETNTRIQLIVLAIEEVQRLFKKLQLSVNSHAVPGTIGDLILTCNSTESRNFRFGQLLASHKALDSLKKVKETVEGYYTLDSIPYLEDKASVTLPLASFIKTIVAADDPKKVHTRFNTFIKMS